MLHRDTEPMLYSISEVARMIGFSRTKTYEMIRGGKIPHIVVEKRMRVRRQDLKAWIDGASRHH
jgi:excisionase family DNA binding protein